MLHIRNPMHSLKLQGLQGQQLSQLHYLLTIYVHGFQEHGINAGQLIHFYVCVGLVLWGTRSH